MASFSFPAGPLRWLRQVLRPSRALADEAAQESLRRMRVFAPLTLCVNLGYLLYFWLIVPAGADAAVRGYQHRTGLIHLVCALGMLVLTTLARLPADMRQWLAPRATQWLVSLWGAGFGIALTLNDQSVGSNTTNYVMVVFIVAMLGLLRPLDSLGLFSAAYALLYWALGRVQTEPGMLEMARSHSFSGTVMGVAAAWVMWRQFATAARLRHALTATNADLQRKQDELLYLARHDTLTGLHNRRAFLLQAEHELHRAQRYGTETGLLVADLDHFKQVNDHHGHPAGDAVLVAFASVLKAQLRESDIAARLGGEEFIVLLPATAREGTLAVAHKIRQAMAQHPVLHGGQRLAVTVSLGATNAPPGQSCDVDHLYAQADRALYAAKAQGRDRVAHHGDLA
ncbi:MAG: GGDEF domain-containing protein [Rhodoferax sp.]